MNGSPAWVPEPTVEAHEVSKWFGAKVAVSGVSCAFGPGVTGLLGPNGAGKTTLLRALVGLLRPSQGSVRVLGEDPRSRPHVYGRLALVQEEEAVYGSLTAQQFVALSAGLSRRPNPSAAAERALAEVELSDVAHRRLSTFSKGMRQRAKVAAALATEPQILFLDEPLDGTDPVQRARLMRLFVDLGRNGHTVIVSSHVLSEVERMAERVIAMVDGRLVAAGPVEAIRSAMSDVPRRVLVESDHPRRLGALILHEAWTQGVEVRDGRLHVQTEDVAALGRALPVLARRLNLRIIRVEPEDESLESVFRYLVGG